MKKIFFIMLLSAGTLFASAQYTQVKSTALTTTSYGNALDTVTNTATKVTTPFKNTNWSKGVTVGVVVTKISGTVAGSLALQGSPDGINWFTVGSATTPSDASANYSFNTTVGWLYYRVSWAGAGTMSASLKSFIQTY
jgi:hypothetical protein